MRFRLATPDDLSTLIAIEERCFKLDRFSRRQWHYLLTKAKATTWLAVEGAEAVGTASAIWPPNRVARLYSLAVLPEWRGHGIATRLIQAAENEARKRGYAIISAEVRADNRASLKRFSEAGYSLYAEILDYYEDGEKALRFRKAVVK